MTSPTNATQSLNQNICQRYGWGIDYTNESDGKLLKWFCTVWVGMYDKRYFASDGSYPDTAAGRKEGKSAVSESAIEGLQQVINHYESLPVKTLLETFPCPLPIYESNNCNWNNFWKNRPDVVGIDTEGNQMSPPVLVQISTDDYVILEVPVRGKMSDGLMRLLSDDGVIKVFCDNASHKDKVSLGLVSPESITDTMSESIVDVEVMATEALGPSKIKRGISKLVTLIMPELMIRVENKQGGSKRVKHIYRFCMIEQGKMLPFRSIRDLTSKEKEYAALDAWITLQLYRRLITATPR